MPTDIVKYDDQTELAAYMKELSEARTDIDSDVNPNKLTPRICMSKDNDLLTVKMDESIVGSPSKYLYVLIIHSVGLRSLWCPESHPAKESYKGPVCTTGLVSTTVLSPDKGQGVWTINNDFAPPYTGITADGTTVERTVGEEVSYECVRCPHNRFESETNWDHSKQSKGKACKESRVLFVRIMDKATGIGAIKTPNGEELNAFDLSQGEVMRLNLGLGSNKKPYEDMIIAAKSRGLPVGASVWKLSVFINVNGSIKYPSAKFEFVGFPTKPAFMQVKSNDAEWVKDYVERNARQAMEADIKF